MVREIAIAARRIHDLKKTNSYGDKPEPKIVC